MGRWSRLSHVNVITYSNSGPQFYYSITPRYQPSMATYAIVCALLWGQTLGVVANLIPGILFSFFCIRICGVTRLSRAE